MLDDLTKLTNDKLALFLMQESDELHARAARLRDWPWLPKSMHNFDKELDDVHEVLMRIEATYAELDSRRKKGKK